MIDGPLGKSKYDYDPHAHDWARAKVEKVREKFEHRHDRRRGAVMRFAYADPPYLGCGKLYPEHPEALAWDNPKTHGQLVNRLCDEYPDGWAMSLSTPSLSVILPMCPGDVRIAAWVKPFAAYKRNVRVAYTWEPVILRGGRISSKDGATPTRDHLAEPITLRRGLTGAKPARFCRWVLDLLGYIDGDRVDDLFPGTGVMDRVIAQAVLNLDGEAS